MFSPVTFVVHSVYFRLILILLIVCSNAFQSCNHCHSHPTHDYAEVPLPLEEQLKEEHDQEELIAPLQNKQFVISRFQGDDETIMF